MRALRIAVAPALRQAEVSAARWFSFSNTSNASDDEGDSDATLPPPRPKSTVTAARDLMQPRFDRQARKKGQDGRPLRRLEHTTTPKEARDQATRAAAEAHIRSISWMSPYLDHPAAADDQGYSVLGTVGRVVRDREEPTTKKKAPTSLQAELQADFQRVRENVPQINAQKKYLFKDTYSPQELNPYKRAKQRVENRTAMVKNLQHKGTLQSALPPLRFTDTQVRREVDYKNIPMLVTLVGKQGAILGRRKGHIRAVTQRKVARAVKNARQMALMPHIGMHPAYADGPTSELQEVFDELDLRASAAHR